MSFSEADRKLKKESARLDDLALSAYLDMPVYVLKTMTELEYFTEGFYAGYRKAQEDNERMGSQD